MNMQYLRGNAIPVGPLSDYFTKLGVGEGVPAGNVEGKEK